MSLKKVRRGGKTDGEDDETMEQDISIIPQTPDDGNRTMRTRRQLKLKNIDESDVIESSPQLNESKRPGRKPRGKKIVETADDSVNISVAVNSRKRTKKDKDDNVTLLTKDSILTDHNLTQVPVSTKKARGRKRVIPEKVDPVVDNECEVENVSSVGTKVTLDNDQDEELNEDKEVKAASKQGRKHAATPINPRTRQLRNRNVNSPGTIVTPESSPITVHLTPHRTTKTPRKSPVNIGSPKTHTLSPQRMSKTPRKLSIITDSPISSDHGTPHTDSPKNSSSRKSGKSPRLSLKSPKSPRILLKSPKSLRVSLRSSKSPKSPRNSLKSPKFSETSLKSPKSSTKSSKSPGKSPKSPEISSRSSKSPQASTSKSPGSPKILLKSPKSKSPRVLSTKIRKSPKNGPATPIKSPYKSPSKQASVELPKTNEKVKSPQLVLRKLSPRKRQEKILETPVSNNSTLENLPEKPASPRRSKHTVIKRSSITTSGTPLRPIPTPKHNDSKKSAHKSFVGDTNTPLTLFAMKHGSGLMSSTPREKIRRSLNISLNYDKSLDLHDSPLSVQSFYGKSSPRASTRIHNESTYSKIVDETNPLITDDESFEMSGIKTVEQSQQNIIIDDQNLLVSEDEGEGEGENLNNTYELDEPQTPGLKKKKEKNSSNDTYELDEPKTPALRKKRAAVETSIIAGDGAEEKGTKRVCRVRFASPSVNDISVVIKKTKDIATRTATPGKTTLKKTGFVTIRNPNKTNKTSPRRRSNSLSNVPKPRPSSAKKRSLSTIDLSRSAQKTLQNESVNRLSKPRHSMQSDKKPEAKPMSARKIPNFAQIHQKKFEKMESIVDAKKRVENRHNALTNNLQVASTSACKLITPNTLKTASRSTKVAATIDKGVSPGDTVNGVFNRFGYKVRKEEATKIINKKLPTKTSEEKKTEKRTILKGVRSNRRFEMLMNLRKMNQ